MPTSSMTSTDGGGVGAGLVVVGAVGVGGDDGFGHVGGGGEVAAVAGFDRGDAERDREVGFAASGLA